MRISDWSSDVCSSDLRSSSRPYLPVLFRERHGTDRTALSGRDIDRPRQKHTLREETMSAIRNATLAAGIAATALLAHPSQAETVKMTAFAGHPPEIGRAHV